MAEEEDVTADNEDTMSMVTLVQSPWPGSLTEKWTRNRNEVRSILSRGRAVVILWGISDSLQHVWDEESMVLLTGQKVNRSPMQWQCEFYMQVLLQPAS